VDIIIMGNCIRPKDDDGKENQNNNMRRTASRDEKNEMVIQEAKHRVDAKKVKSAPTLMLRTNELYHRRKISPDEVAA
jgi:hypothetical protein